MSASSRFMQMRALPPDADAGGAPARSGIHGCTPSGAAICPVYRTTGKRQAEIARPGGPLSHFPPGCMISLIRPAERSVHNGQGKWRIYFFYKFYLSGRPCVFCKGPICLPNETLAGREPSLLRPGLGLHRRALHQRRWRPAPHGPHGPQQQRPIIGFRHG